MYTSYTLKYIWDKHVDKFITTKIKIHRRFRNGKIGPESVVLCCVWCAQIIFQTRFKIGLFFFTAFPFFSFPAQSTIIYLTIRSYEMEKKLFKSSSSLSISTFGNKNWKKKEREENRERKIQRSSGKWSET